MVVLAWPPWRGRGWDAVVGVAALLLALAGGRAVLLGLIDASTMPVASPRYVYPAVAPFTCGAFLLVVAAAGRLRAARRALPETGPTVQASGKRTARPRRA
jgi:hypothetical protein